MPWNISFSASAASRTTGVYTSPTAIFKLLKEFFAAPSLDLVVAYLLFASFVSATFSSHAVFATFTALVNVLAAKARDFSILPCRIPDSPRSSRTSVALSP
ncbi:hypothetical protein [Gemmiger sp.]|uniref:hypothetical protein n=1 Tax=Gemmiger sp. TaxID=2049027 RepID=UPI003079D8E9